MSDLFHLLLSCGFSVRIHICNLVVLPLVHGYSSTTAFGNFDTTAAVAFSIGQRNSQKIWFCSAWTSSPTTAGDFLCGSVQLLPSAMSQGSKAPRSSSMPTPPNSPITVPFELQGGVNANVGEDETERVSGDDNALGCTAMDQSMGNDAGVSLVGFGDVMPTAVDVSQSGMPAETDLLGGEDDLGAWLERIAERPKDPRITERLQPDRAQELPVATGSVEYGVDRCLKSLSPSMPKFFWEEDPFLKTIFCKDDANTSLFKRPQTDFDLTVSAPSDVWTMLKRPKQVPTTGICEQVIKHIEMKDEADKRTSVISNWSSLVCINLDAFALGDTLDASGDTVTHAVVNSSLRACFAQKATSTLSKRFYAVNRFVNFCCRNGLQFFPLREHVVFQFLQAMVADEHTAPSAGRSLLEALRFCRSVLGLKGDMAELGTMRVDGLAVELGRRAGPIQQAQPLTVQQVMSLERLVAQTEDIKDKVVFGGLLVLLYSCGRFSDGQRAVSMILDTDLERIDSGSLDAQGYVELQVLGHKSARSETLKRMVLPLVAPIFSLSSADWFRSWIHAREILGLPVQGRLNYPLICRFDIQGKAIAEEITSAEASALLRRALKIPEQERAFIRSHSLKCTPLSWSCKYGTDLPTRRLLGHHLDPHAISPETYGRDSMGPAVRCLESTLRDIKAGEFRPDETRSGRFVRAAQSEIAQTEAEPGGDTDSDSDFIPSSSDSESSDEDPFGRPSEASLLWHLVLPDLRPGYVDVPDSILVFRNNVSGMQHLKQPGALKFLCGRREGYRYTYYAGKPIRGVAMCDHCIGSRELARAETS